MAVDGAGNLYIDDDDNNRIRKVTAGAAALSFPNTAVGGTSATQTVNLNNIGNTALTVSIPGTGQNPSQSSYFTQSNSSTCPLVYSSSSSAGTLASGATCTEILSYSPTVSGSVTGNLIFTDNSLNATKAVQTVVETGSTLSTLSISVIGQNVPQGTSSITLEFIVGYGGNTAPTGTPTLTVNGSATNVSAIACTVKTGHNNCTATYNPSSLAPGLYTITATQPADSNYSATSANGTLTITGTSPVIFSSPVRGVFTGGSPVAVSSKASSAPSISKSTAVPVRSAGVSPVPSVQAPVFMAPTLNLNPINEDDLADKSADNSTSGKDAKQSAQTKTNP